MLSQKTLIPEHCEDLPLRAGTFDDPEICYSGHKVVVLDEPQTYELGGRSYPVHEAMVFFDSKGKRVSIPVPIVELKWMPDYKWQLDFLIDRLEHQEKYEATEDVPAVIAQLRKWLAEHEPDHV